MFDETNVGTDEAVAMAEEAEVKSAGKGAGTKKAKTPKAPPAPKVGNFCIVCGKPLTDPDAIAKGMGALCEHDQNPDAKRERKTKYVVEAVPEGYITIAKGIQMLKDTLEVNKIPPHRLVKATGGDTQRYEPLGPDFVPVIVKGTRYLNPACVTTPENLALLAGMKTERKPAEPKLDAEGKPIKQTRKAKPKAEEPEATKPEDRVG